MGLFDTVFGVNGAMSSTFSDYSFIAGLFILIFFVIYMYSRNASTENILLVSLLFFILVISNNLFAFPSELIIVIVTGIVLYASVFVYYWFNK